MLERGGRRGLAFPNRLTASPVARNRKKRGGGVPGTLLFAQRPEVSFQPCPLEGGSRTHGSCRPLTGERDR